MWNILSVRAGWRRVCEDEAYKNSRFHNDCLSQDLDDEVDDNEDESMEMEEDDEGAETFTADGKRRRGGAHPAL